MAPVLVAVTLYDVSARLVVGVPVILPVLKLKFIPLGSAPEIAYVIMPVPDVAGLGPISVKRLFTVPIEEEE